MRPENWPAACWVILAPVACDVAAAVIDVAAEIELVAVAGAMQAQVKTIAVGQRIVGSAAPNAFARSARQNDIPATRPRSGPMGEWTLLLRRQEASTATVLSPPPRQPRQCMFASAQQNLSWDMRRGHADCRPNKHVAHPAAAICARQSSYEPFHCGLPR